MTDTPTKLFAVICLLLGVWVLTYWLYEPTSAKVMLDPRIGEVGPNPTPDPTPVPSVTERPPLPKPVAVLPTPDPNPAPRTRRVQKVIQPQFKTYTVRKGDTSLGAIAARSEVYGDASKGHIIAKANPFVSPDRLKPGVTTLRIPVDPDNIQGKVVEVDEPIAEVPADPPPQVQPPTPAHPPEQTYTITRNDTLWEIAKRFYGRGAAWRTIYEANKDRIPDPDRPPAGVTIRIPESP